MNETQRRKSAQKEIKKPLRLRRFALKKYVSLKDTCLKNWFTFIWLGIFLGVLALGLCTACTFNDDDLPAPTATSSRITSSPTKPVVRQATFTPTVLPSPVPVTPPPSSSPTPLTLATNTPLPATLTVHPPQALKLGLVAQVDGWDDLNPLINLNPDLAQLSPLLYQTLGQVATQTGQADLNWQFTAPLSLTYTQTQQAQAIQTSLQQSLWPAVKAISKVSLQNKDVLTLSLKTRDCSALASLAAHPIVNTIVPKAEDDTPVESEASHTQESGPSLGSGPFIIKNLLTQTNILHVMAQSEQAQLTGLEVHFLADEQAALAKLKAGALDILPLSKPPSDLPAGYRMLAYPAPRLNFITFNTQDTLLGQAEVREALSLALNRKRILAEAFQGYGSLAASSLPPYHWAAQANLKPPNYAPQSARLLLNKLGLVDTDGDGWRNNPETGENWILPLRVDRDAPRQVAVALLAADDYRQVGLKAQAEAVPFFILLDDLRTYDYSAVVYTWPVFAEPNLFQRWHSTQIEADYGLNLAAYSNPQVDAWLAEARETPDCDLETRRALYQQVQIQLAKDRPFDFLVIPKQFVVIRESVGGVAPGPFAPITWNGGQWHWREKQN